MFLFLKRLLTIYGVIVCIFSTASGQSKNELVPALNNYLMPLNAVSPSDDFSDLQKLKEVLKDKAIVGMGEATHGTHEFSTVKQRIMEFLVKEMGFKTFVIEADFAGTQTLNDYVLYGKGNARYATWHTAGPYALTQEFLDMVQWVRTYNDTKAMADKVSFYGFDMQWGVYAADSLKAYLTQTHQLTPEIDAGFAALNKYQPSLTNKEKSVIHTAVSALAQIQFIGIDTNQVAMYRHDLRELQQCWENMDAKSVFHSADQSDARDKYMAENIMWIYNHTNHNKMMVWAHNAHIGKSSGSQKYQRMGMLLSQTFKDQYYAFGFDFGTGGVRVYDMKTKQNVTQTVAQAKPGSSGAWFAACNVANFILDFKSASSNTVINDFLHKPVASIFIGAETFNEKSPYYITHQLADTYDGMVFIRETTPIIAAGK